MFKVPEKYRLTTGRMGSSELDGNNGQFVVKTPRMKRPLYVQASDGAGWEHVSVSLPHRCPTWEEMCLIKRMFWDEDDLVVQLHPVAADYINCHPTCLHMWRKCDTNDYMETPDPILVGL